MGKHAQKIRDLRTQLEAAGSAGLMRAVPKKAEYGGARYAYGLAPEIPFYSYAHPLGELVLIGPNEDNSESWQLSFFPEADESGQAAEWRILEPGGAEEEEMLAMAEDVAMAIKQLRTIEQIDGYFQEENFDAV